MDLKISRLSAIYGLSKSTIKRKFSKIKEQIPQKLNLKEVVVLCDASYWGKRYSFGVVVFKDSISKKILWWKFIYKKERINDYLDGIKYLQDCGYEIKAVVSDGLAGLAKSISPLPFQFCQYHMKKNIARNITNNPKTGAGINLLQITNAMFYLNSTEFKELLENFYSEFGDFLSENKGTARRSRCFCEKTTNENGKSFYTHKRLRSAYFSLKRNSSLLFTYEKFNAAPNTNNALESFFTDLKTATRIHKGLNLITRAKFISWYFTIKNNQN